jgi:hypothetical protein
MELREYIAETLKQLIDGIVDAQEYAETKGASINPRGLKHGFQSHQLEVAQDSVQTEIPQMIEFDVAVTVSESGEAKAGVGVFAVVGVGAHAIMQDANVKANRIRFSMPVMFPQQKKH